MLCAIPLFIILRFTTAFTEVIRAMQGRPVHIPCSSSFTFHHLLKFQWRMNGKLFCVYDMEANITTPGFCPSRFDISRHPGKFYISDPQVSDSGQYNCSITGVIPPPYREEYHIVDLQVEALPDLILTLLNRTSSCIQLLCTLVGSHTQEVNFTWFRQGQGSMEPLSVNHSSTTSSSVILCQSDWREGDRFTCQVNASADDGLSNSITVPHADTEGTKNNNIIIIIIGSIFGGLVAIAAVGFCVHQCKMKCSKGDSISYNNQVYENFHFQQSIKPDNEDQCIYENDRR